MSAAPAGGDKKNIVKMAYIYFQEGRWDKAIEEYKKLIALDPEDINTHNMLGDVYVKKGATREAFEEYIKVSADFSSRGASDKAAIVNKKIAALDSSLLPAEAQKRQSLIKQSIKAESAMEQGNVDEAIEALSEVAKLDSENLGAYAKLGELFEKKGQIPQAVQQYQMLGGVFIKNRLFKKAQEMFQRVVALEPNNIEARINLAQIFIKQGSESDAKKEFLVIAELALNAGDIENANTYATKAVEFKSIEAHYVLGMVFFKKQQLSEAKAEFESLLRFKVNHVGALTYLGKVYLETNQVDKASENIQKALKIEKDNLVAMEAWVELCVKKGNKAEAIKTLVTLVDRYSGNNDLTKAIEFSRYMVSVDENSIAGETKLGELLKQSGDKNGAADVFFKVALIHEKQNKKEPMMEFVRKTLELNPGHSEAQKRMMGDVTSGSAGQPPSAASAAPAVTKSVDTIGKIPATDVLDLEQETVKPPKLEAPRPEMTQTEKPRPAAFEADSQEELKAQLAIASDYVKQGLVQEAIEIYQQLLESHPNHPELKEKLNQAYTAYVKTGDDVIDALEAEKKAKEEEEKHLRQEMEKKALEEAKRLRAEMEQKARVEAEKQARAELEKKAREEAEKRAAEEMDRMAREAVSKKNKEEVEKKVKEELEKRAQEEAAKKTKEEVDRKVKEELMKRAQEEKEKNSKKAPVPASEIKTSRTEPPSKGDQALEEDKDGFMTIAVADIYTRQGLYDEASKIYNRILQMEPDNLEAKKKLSDLENLRKPKGGPPSHPPDPPPAGPGPSSPPPHPSSPEKDSGGKKKPNRVGYV
jgi:tetratricopeptide (TPR) repeat protein